MSGDVQPRKRKDKKRKKDELGVEEPRGTAAVLGEGDVFMHSQHEHGTGGHWCAKVIFFSLLAVLVTLIGLIILENRGLSELEANAVESRYSGVLDGWLEDAPDDDHHDEHTLELKHHEDEDVIDHDEQHDSGIEHDDEDGDESHEDEEAQDDEDEETQESEDDDNDSIDDDDNDEDNEQEDVDDQSDDEDDNELDNNGSEEQQDVDADLEDELESDAKYDDDDDNDNEDEDENEDSNDNEENDDSNEMINQQKDDASIENNNDDNEDSIEQNDDDDDDDDDDDKTDNYDNDDEDDQDRNSIERDIEDDVDDNDSRDNEDKTDEEEHEEHEEAQAEESEEVEKIEREVTDDEVISSEVPVMPYNDDDDKGDSQENTIAGDDSDTEETEFLEPDDDDHPIIVERITAPSGKPFAEVEEETSSEKPPNTLDEEEEYEKKQEERRREEAQSSSHMWLKLAVGGALLVATHAVISRATAPRDTDTTENDEHATREETPSVVDRRMTLLAEELAKKKADELSKTIAPEEIAQKTVSFVRSTPFVKQESEEIEDDDKAVEEEEEEEEIPAPEMNPQQSKVENKELYSDDEEEVEEEEIVEEPKVIPKPSAPVVESKPKETENEEYDVEIIEEEEAEEDEDEEEISDVDDEDLLTRLEAKYGRLPEPERPGPKHKDGGNSIEEQWPGDPNDPFWREQLDLAEQELRQGSWSSCEKRVAAPELKDSGRARWLAARSLDLMAEARRDNKLLSKAIAAYLHLLKMNDRLSDTKILEVARRAIDRIQFRGTYLNAEPIYRLLIRRFPNDVNYRNNLTVSFLMANRADLASDVLKETLKLWPNDRVALAHYGFVLKTEQNRLEEAVTMFRKALEGDAGSANEPRFYYHLGDALLLLGRFEEAHEVHKRGAKLGHFLSPAQRSLYNVPRLRSRAWWPVEETPYVKLARALEGSWREILKEGEAARALYEKEKEGLRERGEWSQLDLFVRGREIPGRCARAPVTCAIVRTEPAAAGCRRGQVKFSAMEAGTHVRPHVGPTNCRLRMHLGLTNTKYTYIRVDKETRQWQTGKVFIFDDSFEHEVWHNGTGARLVLIVDVWHPDLTPAERRQLPAI